MRIDVMLRNERTLTARDAFETRTKSVDGYTFFEALDEDDDILLSVNLFDLVAVEYHYDA